MAVYTVRLDNVTGPDVISVGDGTTYATLSVNTNVSTPLVSDTNPTLSADLDLNGNDITGTGNISVAGFIALTGTVDGRDVAADGSKLDGIEALADVTDTTNVTAAGALMDSELTDIAAVKALDQGVATTDDPTFTNTQLGQIAASKAVTAVDVFVYDTSKDSDGGAWRKRTQGTSWYNETLNTATRGSRKEFPSVAVIVAEADKVTIYDGDDPSLPMWMVFNGTSPNMLYAASGINAFSCVSALNGVISVGNDQYDIWRVFLPSDKSDTISTSGIRDYLGNIAERNASKGRTDYDNSTVIVDRAVNDVAMTVLPNAPIDAATGLPVPTIAVATDGGVSVIKDDGTVVDSSSTIIVWVMFDEDTLYFEYSNSAKYQLISTLADGFSGYDFAESLVTTPIYAHGTVSDNANAVLNKNTISVGSGATSKAGLGIYHKTQDTTNYGSLASLDSGYRQAVITSDYNTGWMNGDIKGAFLSSTDTASLVGSALNNTTDYTTEWTQTEDGWTISATSLSCDGVDNLEYAVIDLAGLGLAVGDQVGIELTISTYTGGSLFVSFGGGGSALTAAMTATGTYKFAQEKVTTTALYLRSYFFNGTVTGIKITKADADRSVNGNGLQVFGTVTKNPVATGADLVAYSGFSNSNHLTQPYNSDLDYGTGDFAFCAWFKSTNSGNSEYIIDRRDSSGTGNKIIVFKEGTTNKLRVFASTTGNTTTSAAINTGVWTQIWFVRRSGTTYAFINGELSDTFTNQAGSVTNTSATLCVGDTNTHSGNSFVRGSVALVRTSATAPSPEQIAKIYEDEKVLFQENAQATLYGSSDAVTALAYDDSTEILSVGTSAGRSDFQGLRRVNNTTTAVGTAISASNNLIVED